MNIFFQKTVRLWIILIAFLLGLIIVYYFVKPKILEPLCLVNSNNCLKIIYKNIGDTSLIFVDPINRWFWFNDGKIYVYGEMGGKYCQNTDEFEPAYVLDATGKGAYPGAGEGYQCIKKLELVLDYYNLNKGDWNVVMHHIQSDKSVAENVLTVQEIINILLKKRILFNQ